MREDNRGKRVLNRRFVITYLLGYVVLNFLFLGIFAVVPEDISEQVSLNVVVIVMTLWYIGLAVALGLIGKRYLFTNQWEYLKSNIPRSIVYIVLGTGALIGGAISINLIFYFGFGIEPDPENQAQLVNMATSSLIGAIGVIIFGVFCAPLVEELVFRKAIFGMIQKRAGLILAIIGNSFLFALIHVVDDVLHDANLWYNIFPYMGPGIILSIIYYRSGKMIWIPIIIHTLYNGYSILMMFLGHFFLEI